MSHYLLRRILFFIIIYLFFSAKSEAQLSLTTSVTASQLASEITGPGVSIFNATYSGDLNAEGLFTANGTNLGLTTGILLSTGYDTTAIGPNNDPGASTDFREIGDAELTTLADTDTYDAAVLEFDFIPQSDTIKFSYVFASEEYPEYVCSPYNDVFGFFITGPGIVGVENMAVVPGSGFNVTINTINGGSVGAAAGFPAPGCILSDSSYYIDNTNGSSIQYDGFTIVLVAQAVVFPCQTYHLKIAIADAADHQYDSGVFLKGGSLTSTPIVNAGPDIAACVNTNVNIGIAGTTGWTYQWSPATGIDNPAISNPTLTLSSAGNFQYVLSGNNGTCTYTDTLVANVTAPVTAQFSTPAHGCVGDELNISYTGNGGNANYQWTFNGGNIISGSNAGPYIVSWNTPGDYPLTLSVTTPLCSTLSQTDSIHISKPVVDAGEDTSVCSGTLFSMNNNSASGNSYQWTPATGFSNSSDPHSAIQLFSSINAIETTIFYLTATDSFGCSNEDSIQININPLPVVNAGNDTIVCSDASFLSGQSDPSYTYQWNPTSGITNATNGIASFQLSNNTLQQINSTYFLTAKSAAGCINEDSVSITITPVPVAKFVSPSPECFSGNSFNFSNSNAVPQGAEFTWTFSNAIPASSDVDNPSGVTFDSVGSNNVTVSAEYLGCDGPVYASAVRINPMPLANFYADITQGCIPLDVDLFNSDHQDSINYLWSINGGSMTGSEIDYTFNSPGSYDISLRTANQFGCLSMQTKLQYITTYPLPVAKFNFSPTDITFPESYVQFQNLSSGGYQYNWNFDDGNMETFFEGLHYFSDTGVYIVQLQVMTEFGCLDTISAEVYVEPGFTFYIPTAFSPNADGRNDVFNGYGTFIRSSEMWIFDRWGKMIFYSDDSSKGWDGRIDSYVQNDVYVYRFVVTDVLGKEHTYLGSIEVFR